MYINNYIYISIHILGNTHPLAIYFRVHIPVLECWPRIMFDDVWWTIRVARPRVPWRLARTRAPEPTLGRHLVSWKACEAARRVSWVMIWDDMSRDFLLPSKHVDRKQQAREPAETNLQNCGPATTPQTWARQELGWHGDTSNKQALQDIINIRGMGVACNALRNESNLGAGVILWKLKGAFCTPKIQRGTPPAGNWSQRPFWGELHVVWRGETQMPCKLQLPLWCRNIRSGWHRTWALP